jgi:hypothetical protein
LSVYLSKISLYCTKNLTLINMKRLIYTLLLIVFITAGCQEKESVNPLLVEDAAPSKIEALTGNSSKKWLMIEAKVSDPSIYNVDSCNINNTSYTFKSDKYYEYDVSKCEGYVLKSPYSFNADSTIIYITAESNPHKIMTLTTEKLVLESPKQSVGNGKEVTITYTYKPVN